MKTLSKIKSIEKIIKAKNEVKEVKDLFMARLRMEITINEEAKQKLNIIDDYTKSTPQKSSIQPKKEVKHHIQDQKASKINDEEAAIKNVSKAKVKVETTDEEILEKSLEFQTKWEEKFSKCTPKDSDLIVQKLLNEWRNDVENLLHNKSYSKNMHQICHIIANLCLKFSENLSPPSSSSEAIKVNGSQLITNLFGHRLSSISASKSWFQPFGDEYYKIFNSKYRK